MGPRERHRIIIIIIALSLHSRRREAPNGEKKRERERDKEREKVIRTFFMCVCVFVRVCELWSVCVSKYRSLRGVCTRNEKRFAK